MTPPEIPPGYEKEADLLREEGEARRELGRQVSERLFADLVDLSRREAQVASHQREEGS